MSEVAQLIFSLATMCAVLGNFWLAWKNTKQIKAVVHNTNSITDRLEKAASKSGFAEGVKSEQDRSEKDRSP